MTSYKPGKNPNSHRVYGNARPELERFWEKVQKQIVDWKKKNYSPCWLWTGAKGKNGYGIFHVDGRAITAHRFSWELHYFKIPTGFQINHVCNNTTCVRPTHLQLAFGPTANSIQAERYHA